MTGRGRDSPGRAAPESGSEPRWSHVIRRGAGEAAVPHVLVDDVDVPELGADDRHHLERVLRVRSGARLTVGDGAGRWRQCLMGTVLEPVGAPGFDSAPEPRVTVGFAALKGGRSNHVVQKLTELGVDRIVPFTSARSVVRWDEPRAARLLERWRRVAREAVMQCRRLWLPEIEPLRDFADLDIAGAALCAMSGRGLTPGEHFLLVGPEGGWSDSEMAAVPRHVVLSDNVLRADTAAVAAATLLAAARSGHLPSAQSAGPGGE